MTQNPRSQEYLATEPMSPEKGEASFASAILSVSVHVIAGNTEQVNQEERKHSTASATHVYSCQSNSIVEKVGHPPYLMVPLSTASLLKGKTYPTMTTDGSSQTGAAAIFRTTLTNEKHITRNPLSFVES